MIILQCLLSESMFFIVVKIQGNTNTELGKLWQSA